MKKWLLRSPSQKDITRLFQAWRLWLLSALLGSLLGGLAYLIFPPPFRAQATVVVDHNLEQAWPDAQTERDLFTYLARETSKLVEVAWSDVTLQRVVNQVPATTIADLRDKQLHLSQPGDGAWHFWADDANPKRAAQIASAWAQAFTAQVRLGVDTALRLEAVHVALKAGACSGDMTAFEAKAQQLESQSLGVSPYIQVSLSQAEQLPVQPTVSLATYLFAGVMSGFVLATCAVLFFGSDE